MDQDDKKSFCLLRFEVSWTSAAEDVSAVARVIGSLRSDDGNVNDNATNQ